MTRLSRDDRGQITTALVMVGIVMLVALGLLVTKLGQATDQKSKVQTAADAAALAGAQQIRMDAPGLILGAIGSRLSGSFPDNGCSGMGEDRAGEFARRADAEVTDYCYTPSTDTVQVYVKSQGKSVSGAPAKAEAQARVGWTLGDCDTLPAPTFTTTPPAPDVTTTSPPDSTTTTPPPAPTTTPPADVHLTVHCGSLPIEIVLDGASGDITHLPSQSEIFDLFTPALKS